MKTRDQIIEEIYDRACEKRNWKLKDLIISEGLQEYTPGTITVLHDDLSVSIAVCNGYLIIARDRYNAEEKSIESEYAIYSEHDNDNNEPLLNQINANATYRLEYVCEETFANNALAIVHACEAIKERGESIG